MVCQRQKGKCLENQKNHNNEIAPYAEIKAVKSGR